jgi:hypothetical protein
MNTNYAKQNENVPVWNKATVYQKGERKNTQEMKIM